MDTCCYKSHYNVHPRNIINHSLVSLYIILCWSQFLPKYPAQLLPLSKIIKSVSFEDLLSLLITDSLIFAIFPFFVQIRSVVLQPCQTNHLQSKGLENCGVIKLYLDRSRLPSEISASCTMHISLHIAQAVKL